VLYRGASAWSVLAPGTSGQILQTGGTSANPSWTNAAGGGTVTSVTFTGDGTLFSSTPSSAVTTTGTLTAALANQSANVVLAGPASGSAAAPTFRALVNADLPAGVPFLQYEQYSTVTTPSTPTGLNSLTSGASFRGSLTVAAGALNAVGRALEIEFAGYGSTAASPGNGSLNLTIGGTAVACTNSTSLNASKTNSHFYGRIRLVVASTGSSGTANIFGMVANAPGAAGIFAQTCVGIANTSLTGNPSPQTPVTLNLTGTLAFDLQMNYASGVSGNAMSLPILSIKLIP
jgi:hypothetical protein